MREELCDWMRKWVRPFSEAKSAGAKFKTFRKKHKNHPVEVVGAKLRELMSCVNSKETD
jgi:ketol-acid reductoisomerase